MAVEKKAKIEAVDPWETDKSTWEYVGVPAENALGEVHATMGNNRHNFQAGKTYLLPQAYAEDLKERLKVYARSCIRILQPKRDMDAVNRVPVGSVGGSQIYAVEASEVTSPR
jgi:hypothetical protein